MFDDEWICPYNETHVLKGSHTRYINHITKCVLQYPDDNKVHCRYNYGHIVDKKDLAEHFQSCPDSITHRVNVKESMDFMANCCVKGLNTIKEIPEHLETVEKSRDKVRKWLVRPQTGTLNEWDQDIEDSKHFESDDIKLHVSASEDSRLLETMNESDTSRLDETKSESDKTWSAGSATKPLEIQVAEDLMAQRFDPLTVRPKKMMPEIPDDESDDSQLSDVAPTFVEEQSVFDASEAPHPNETVPAKINAEEMKTYKDARSCQSPPSTAAGSVYLDFESEHGESASFFTTLSTPAALKPAPVNMSLSRKCMASPKLTDFTTTMESAMTEKMAQNEVALIKLHTNNETRSNLESSGDDAARNACLSRGSTPQVFPSCTATVEDAAPWHDQKLLSISMSNRPYSDSVSERPYSRSTVRITPCSRATPSTPVKGSESIEMKTDLHEQSADSSASMGSAPVKKMNRFEIAQMKYDKNKEAKRKLESSGDGVGHNASLSKGSPPQVIPNCTAAVEDPAPWHDQKLLSIPMSNRPYSDSASERPYSRSTGRSTPCSGATHSVPVKGSESIEMKTDLHEQSADSSASMGSAPVKKMNRFEIAQMKYDKNKEAKRKLESSGDGDGHNASLSKDSPPQVIPNCTAAVEDPAPWHDQKLLSIPMSNRPYSDSASERPYSRSTGRSTPCSGATHSTPVKGSESIEMKTDLHEQLADSTASMGSAPVKKMNRFEIAQMKYDKNKEAKRKLESSGDGDGHNASLSKGSPPQVIPNCTAAVEDPAPWHDQKLLSIPMSNRPYSDSASERPYSRSTGRSTPCSGATHSTPVKGSESIEMKTDLHEQSADSTASMGSAPVKKMNRFEIAQMKYDKNKEAKRKLESSGDGDGHNASLSKGSPPQVIPNCTAAVEDPAPWHDQKLLSIPMSNRPYSDSASERPYSRSTGRSTPCSGATHSTPVKGSESIEMKTDLHEQSADSSASMGSAPVKKMNRFEIAQMKYDKNKEAKRILSLTNNDPETCNTSLSSVSSQQGISIPSHPACTRVSTGTTSSPKVVGSLPGNSSEVVRRDTTQFQTNGSLEPTDNRCLSNYPRPIVSSPQTTIPGDDSGMFEDQNPCHRKLNSMNISSRRSWDSVSERMSTQTKVPTQGEGQGTRFRNSGGNQFASNNRHRNVEEENPYDKSLNQMNNSSMRIRDSASERISTQTGGPSGSKEEGQGARFRNAGSRVPSGNQNNSNNRYRNVEEQNPYQKNLNHMNVSSGRNRDSASERVSTQTGGPSGSIEEGQGTRFRNAGSREPSGNQNNSNNRYRNVEEQNPYQKNLNHMNVSSGRNRDSASERVSTQTGGPSGSKEEGQGTRFRNAGSREPSGNQNNSNNRYRNVEEQNPYQKNLNHMNVSSGRNRDSASERVSTQTGGPSGSKEEGQGTRFRNAGSREPSGNQNNSNNRYRNVEEQNPYQKNLNHMNVSSGRNRDSASERVSTQTGGPSGSKEEGQGTRFRNAGSREPSGNQNNSNNRYRNVEEQNPYQKNLNHMNVSSGHNRDSASERVSTQIWGPNDRRGGGQGTRLRNDSRGERVPFKNNLQSNPNVLPACLLPIPSEFTDPGSYRGPGSPFHAPGRAARNDEDAEVESIADSHMSSVSNTRYGNGRTIRMGKSGNDASPLTIEVLKRFDKVPADRRTQKTMIKKYYQSLSDSSKDCG